MAWFFISRVAAALVAVATLFVLTRLLPAEDFARYNIVILSGMIAQQFTFNWIFSSITRFHSNPEFGGRTTAYGLGAAALVTLLLLPLVLLAGLLVPSDWREVFLLTAGVAWASAVHELGLACLRVQHRGPPFAVAAILRPLLATSLAIFLLLRGGGFQDAVFALIVGSIVAGALGVGMAAARSGILRPHGRALHTFFAFGQPLSAVSCGAMLFPLASQLILASVVGLEQVGYFAASMTLTERSLGMLMAMLGQTSAATIFRALDREAPHRLVETLEQHFSFLLLISAPLLAVLVLANDTLARIFFQPDFAAGAAPYLSLLGISAFIHGLQGGFFAFIFEIRRQTVLQLRIAVLLLLVHLATAYVLVSAFGGFGAAYATILTAIISTIVYARHGWDLFRRCALRRYVLQMAAATAAAVPFLLAAEAAETIPLALVLIAAGMLAMLALLKFFRYGSLEIVLGTVLGPRRAS